MVKFANDGHVRPKEDVPEDIFVWLDTRPYASLPDRADREDMAQVVWDDEPTAVMWLPENL